MCCKAHKMVSEIKIVMLALLIGVFSNICILNGATYEVPLSAYSITCGDMDLDGDNDIVIGHNYNSNSKWGGLFIFENDAKGNLQFKDSIYQYSWQTSIYMKNITNDLYPDIVARNSYNETQYMTILEGDSIGFQCKYYQMDYGVSDFTTGDIDGDGDIDIGFYSNNGYFWGYMKNDGTGQFSSPIYIDLGFPPLAIACGDVNNNGMTDIIVGGGVRLSIFYGNNFGFVREDVETTINIYELSVYDIDNDGSNELIIVDGALFGSLMKIIFYKIDNDGNLIEYYRKDIDESLISLSISDLNNDNFSDIIYNAYSSDSTYVLYNENGVSFADPINYQTYFGDTPNYTSTIRSFVADIDGNGLKDIVALNYSYAYENDVTILFQTEAGDFVQDPQSGIEEQDNFVSKVELYQNYPNPFNNETKIQFSLDSSSEVELSVYNSKGELVLDLIKTLQGKGNYNISFNADGFSSGIYYYKLNVNNEVVATKKMLYLK
jgi:hypothetical protein